MSFTISIKEVFIFKDNQMKIGEIWKIQFFISMVLIVFIWSIGFLESFLNLNF